MCKKHVVDRIKTNGKKANDRFSEQWSSVLRPASTSFAVCRANRILVWYDTIFQYYQKTTWLQSGVILTSYSEILAQASFR